MKYWVQPQHDSVRVNSGLTCEEAIERVEILREQYAYLGLRVICRNRLDNPYASKDARLCILNEVLRDLQALRTYAKRERIAA